MAQAAYTHGTSDVTLRGETTAKNYVVVASHADREALVNGNQGVRWTYSRLDREVERHAQTLLVIDLNKGDRVGIWSPNNAEWVVCQLATERIQAILVNINTSYWRHELEHELQQPGCPMLVLAPGFKGVDYTTVSEGDEAPNLRQCVLFGDGWHRLLGRAGEISVDGLHEREEPLEFDDSINIQYTSGTTGFPK